MDAKGPTRDSRRLVNRLAKISARLEQRGIEAEDISQLHEIVREMSAQVGVSTPTNAPPVDIRPRKTVNTNGNAEAPAKRPPCIVVDRSNVILARAELLAVSTERAAFRIVPEGTRGSRPVAVRGPKGPVLLSAMISPAVRILEQLPVETCKMNRGQRRLEIADSELERYLTLRGIR